MKSIRFRLLVWILSGVAILFAVAGSCIYFAFRYELVSEIDDELQQARKVIYNVFENDSLKPGVFVKGGTPRKRLRFREEERWREFDYEDGELFYQLRDTGGEVLLRSTSLAERTIEAPKKLSDPRKPVSLELADGTLLRARIDYANSGQWPEPFRERIRSEESQIEIIVARDTSETGQTLSFLLAGIWIAGILAAGATVIFVTVALRQGLSPLYELGADAAKVDASRLSDRFNDKDLPSELRPICEQLNHLMERLENSFDRERRFSSDLAHEMRTPVTEVCNLAEAAVLFPEKVPAGQYRKILATGKGMRGIVESLLFLSRSEKGAADIEVERIDLAEVVAECLQPYAARAVEKNLVVEIAILPGNFLSTDLNLFRNILNNLISNAIEHSPSGGLVKLEGIETSSEIPIGLSISNPVVEMNSAEVDLLFDRFWRKDQVRSSTTHCGLGLSVARACAEAVSMKLEAVIKGSRIQFDLRFEN